MPGCHTTTYDGPEQELLRAVERARSDRWSDAQVEGAQDLVQQGLQLAEEAGERSAVEQAGHRAQQVAEQVARTGDRRDVEHDAVELDAKPQDVEVQRAEHQVEDVAGGRVGGDAPVDERAAVDLLD